MATQFTGFGAVSESRIWIFELRDRIIWGLCLGVVALGMLIYFFAPPGFLTNILDYLWAQVVIEFRSLPILGVRSSDLKNLAAATARIRSHEAYWVIFTILASAVSIGFFGISTYLLVRQRNLAKKDKVVRGAEFASVKEHNRIMRRNFGKKPPEEMGNPIIIGKEKAIVPEALQYRHFSFCGASGCGKSTAIEEIISHGLRFGHKGFVIDVGGAFYSKFGRPCDHVLSLRDSRSRRWDFWSEKKAPPGKIAAALIEEERSGTKFFWTAARGVWASLIRNSSSVDEVFSKLMRPTEKLRSELVKLGEVSARVLGEGKGNQADGVIGTSALSMEFLRELNQWSAGGQPFSITEWMNDNSDASWTYVLVNDGDLEVAKPLLRVWFELASLAVLARNPSDPNNLHTWLIVDELKTVGQLPSLPSILDKGRKYRASVVLGFQAISQVQKIYGEDDARSILQGLQNQFFFRMTEVESAEYVSDLLGEQDVQKPVFTSGFGAAEYGNRTSVTQSLVKQKLVLPEEICRLETLKAYAKLSGQRPFPIFFEVKNRERVNDSAISEINEEQTERFAAMLADACEKEAAEQEAQASEKEPAKSAVTESAATEPAVPQSNPTAVPNPETPTSQQPQQQSGKGFIPGKLERVN